VWPALARQQPHLLLSLQYYAARQQRSQQVLMKLSGLPQVKTLEDKKIITEVVQLYGNMNSNNKI
jgi:hypothetical protein